jgi:protein O-GlcNAc transferase
MAPMTTVACITLNPEASAMLASLSLEEHESAIRSALTAQDLPSAREHLRKALTLAPSRPDLLGILGQIEHALGAHEVALQAFAQAIRLAPDAAALWINRAATWLALGNAEAAAADARQALRLEQGAFGAHLNLGLALEAQRQFREAAASLDDALRSRPGHPVALAALARCRYQAGKAHSSVRPLLQAALRCHPDDAELGLMLAESLLNDAEVEAALSVFEQLRRAHPNSASLASAHLIALHYDGRCGPKDLLSAAGQWAACFARPETPLPKPPAAPKQGLRVGWISPRFAEGPLVELVLPVMEAMASLGVDMHMYATHVPEDTPAARRFRALAPELHDVSTLDDDALIKLLRDAQLDVLVDLVGHAPGNRLAALSGRAARLQLSWGDWFGSTGLATMDLFVSDAFLSPPGTDRQFSEALLRLNRGRFCYRPGLPTPMPAARADGPLRFVSFNRASKLNDAVLACWAAILRACPGARLQLRGGAFDDPAGCQHFLRRAQRQGIDPQCLELIGFRPHAEVLAAYQAADVALDPFPFSGCATSAEALWMGLPVVTLPGETLVSRQTGALLHRLGLEDCIAGDTDAYIRATVALAGDEARRERLRLELRPRMAERLDPEPLARELLSALQARLAALPS